MSDDVNSKRNFRVSYYDKVGFRGIGEKALVAILKNDAVDKKKLENFCIRFPVPSTYRLLIWKILLDILPVHQQSHKFVMMQRTEQYNDLRKALQVMKMVGSDADTSDEFLKMYLLECRYVFLRVKSEDWHSIFKVIAHSVCDMVDSPVIAYWVSVKTYEFIRANNYMSQLNDFNNIIFAMLKRENNKLFLHLNELDFFDNQPLTDWYVHCYAGVIQCDGSLEKVWDILLGRSARILPYVAIQILLVFERHLLQSNTISKCKEVLEQIPYSDEISDLVVHKAIESWKKFEKIV